MKLTQMTGNCLKGNFTVNQLLDGSINQSLKSIPVSNFFIIKIQTIVNYRIVLVLLFMKDYLNLMHGPQNLTIGSNCYALRLLKNINIVNSFLNLI